MTVKMRIAAIAASGLTGIAILFTAKAPGLGGALIGAALTAGAAYKIVDRHVTQLQTTAADLRDTADQYREAKATFTSQRERMRIQAEVEVEGRLAEAIATLNAAHQAEIFETMRDWYEQGATDVLTGRFKARPQAAEASLASVIQFNPHRPRTSPHGAGCY